MRCKRALFPLFIVFAFACGESEDGPLDPGASNDGGNSNTPDNFSTNSNGNSNANTNDNSNTNTNDNTNTNENETPDAPPVVTLSGRSVSVDGAPFTVRGVCWSPVPKNSGVEGIDFAGFVAQDAPLMAAAGINVVRTYSPITDPAVLDTLWDHGIYVAMTVFNVTSESSATISSYVNAVKDHPAVLFWLVGNEWNYNLLYDSADTIEEAVTALEAAAAHIQTLDDRPVVTVYGGLPDASTIADLPSVDIWGLNVYSGISFFGLFSEWEALSTKPMFLAEYGADAYNANLGQVDTASQATATRELTQEILDNDVQNGGVAFGGTIFEWNDEWWKAGNPSQQDTGGIAPGGGPYPDATFNEEFWGLVDIDRNLRPAYFELQALYGGEGTPTVNRLSNGGFDAFALSSAGPFDPPNDWLAFGAQVSPFADVGYAQYATQASGASIFGPGGDTAVPFPGRNDSRALKVFGRSLGDGAGGIVQTLGTVYQEFGSVPSGSALVLNGHYFVASEDPLGGETRVYLVIKCFTAGFTEEVCGAGSGARSPFVTSSATTDLWQDLSVTVPNLPASVATVQAGVEVEQCVSGSCTTAASTGGSVYFDDLVFTWE